MSTHGLELGFLDLVGDLAHEDGYTISVYADGVTFGTPQAVVREVASMLADGSHVTYDRGGNRVVSFDVAVEAGDGVALAAGEVALRRELYRSNELTWTPPSEFSPPSVYEVITSEMAPKFSDIDEILRGRRVFTVTLTCRPFARSKELVTVQGATPPPVTPVTVTINSADTTTGWSATRADYLIGPGTSAVTVTDQGAYVQATSSGYWLNLKMSLAIIPTSLTATPYLMVEVSGSLGPSFALTLDGVVVRPAPVLTRTTDAGTVLYVFDCGTSTISGLMVEISEKSGSLVTRTINIHDVSATNTFPVVSARQITRIVEVGGTERTQGSLQISSRDGSGMWVTMVHTTPASDFRGAEGYGPSMRPWRTDGNTVTTSAARLSGAEEPIGPDPFIAVVPNSALPDGPYFVAALIKSDTTSTSRIFWAMRTIADSGGGDDIVGEEGRNASFDFTAGVWTLVPLGITSLPIAQSMNAVTRFDIQQEVGDPAELVMDDAYLFWAADGCGLTVVADAKSHLWLDSPDGATLVPTYWTGDEPDRSDSHHPGTELLVPGEHQFLPGLMRVWVATMGTTATYPDVSASFFERWHSNALR